MSNKKAIFNWSGGKDSAMALHKILQAKEFQIKFLLTTVSEQYQRISQHGVRVKLLEQQTESIGIPLKKLMLPDFPTMENYNLMMETVLNELKKEGISHSVFGDIFLEDLRKYREERLKQVDFTGVFPLWKIPTKNLIQDFFDLGFKAIIVCVDEKRLNKSFVGRELDKEFIKDLPANVDVCGENGEYHSFVYDGPIFKTPIKFKKGEIVYRKYIPTTIENNASLRGTKQSQTNNERLLRPEKIGTRNDANSNNVCGNAATPITTGFWYCDLLPAL